MSVVSHALLIAVVTFLCCFVWCVSLYRVYCVGNTWGLAGGETLCLLHSWRVSWVRGGGHAGGTCIGGVVLGLGGGKSRGSMDWSNNTWVMSGGHAVGPLLVGEEIGIGGVNMRGGQSLWKE